MVARAHALGEAPRPRRRTSGRCSGGPSNHLSDLCLVRASHTVPPADSRTIQLTEFVPRPLADAPHVPFGLQPSAKYHPLVDPMSERVSRLHSWASTCYTHSNFARRTRNPTLIDTTPIPYPAPPFARPATLDVIDPIRLMATLGVQDVISTSHALSISALFLLKLIVDMTVTNAAGSLRTDEPGACEDECVHLTYHNISLLPSWSLTP